MSAWRDFQWCRRLIISEKGACCRSLERMRLPRRRLVRGAESDLLSHATVLEMAHRGPRAELLEVPGVGHATMFMDGQQVAPVRDFLLAGN